MCGVSYFDNVYEAEGYKVHRMHSLILGTCTVDDRAAGGASVAHRSLLGHDNVLPSDFIILLLLMVRAFWLLVVRALGVQLRCAGGRLRLREDLGFLGFTQRD